MRTIHPGSQSDIPYNNFEIERDSGTINGDFMRLDGYGPIATGIQLAREQGKLAILDAGCGTGYGLADLKDQISFRAPVPEESIEALGVALSDVRAQSEIPWREKEKLSNGYIALRIGNLGTIDLRPERYDLAYSFEVLLHNEVVAPILSNVTNSLRVGGTYYFNSLVDQTDEIKDFIASQGPRLEFQSNQVTRDQIGGTATRAFHKIVRNA